MGLDSLAQVNQLFRHTVHGVPRLHLQFTHLHYMLSLLSEMISPAHSSQPRIHDMESHPEQRVSRLMKQGIGILV